MPRRKRRDPPDETSPVDVEYLQYWASYQVGGSGMGVSTQRHLKRMARELLEHRGIPIEDPREQSG